MSAEFRLIYRAELARFYRQRLDVDDLGEIGQDVLFRWMEITRHAFNS